LYHLVPVTKDMLKGLSLIKEVGITCYDMCDIVRLKLTTYHDYPFNQHIMNDGSGYFYGCICR
jgi:hypothetical protein